MDNKEGKIKFKKAPGFYRKSLDPKALEKKYLKYIEQKTDQDFIRSAYEEKDGTLFIRKDLDGKAVKRLKLLKKAITQNRKGPLNLIPIVAVAALVAGGIFFFTVLLNPLLQKALETGLEAIFEAKADAKNFRINLIQFEIVMDGLTIADRDSPMKNLIQFDRMAIRLKSPAVLRGKIYIEEIRADAIRFGTPRTVSGALPEKPPKKKPAKDPIEIPPLVDLQNFDAMALLNQEFDKLQTPKLYGMAIDAYDAAAAKWRGQVNIAKSRAEDLQAKAKPLLNININDYKTLDQNTIEQIRARINEVNLLINSVQEAGDEIGTMVTAVQEDIQTAVKLEQNAVNAFNADLSHLKSYLDLSSGAAMDVLDPVIRDILTDSAEEYLAYGERALEVLEKVKEIQAQIPKSTKPVKEKKVKYRGRDVVFPVIQYPKFYLGVLATDVLTPKNWHWAFDLRGVSSDPDLSGTPVTMALSLEQGGEGRKAGFKGMADFRSHTDQRFSTEFTGSGFPVSLGSQLSKIGIGGYSGDAAFEVDLAGFTGGGFMGGGNISLLHSRLVDPANTLTRAMDSVLQEVNSLDLGLKYTHSASEKDSFRVNTNIGDLVLEAVKRTAAQYIKKAEDELERVLREKISGYIDERFLSKEELDLLFAAARGDKAAVDQLKNSLNAKKSEFEQRLRSALGQVEDAARQYAEEVIQQGEQMVEEVKQQAEEIKDDAKRQGEQAIQEALQGNIPSAPTLPTPSISTPSLPSLPSNPLKR